MKKMIQPIRPEELAGLSSMLFGGATLLAATLATWNVAAALRWTQEFAVTNGFLSNWIVWAALAVVLRVAGKHVEREMLERTRMAVVVIPNRPSSPSGRSTAAA